MIALAIFLAALGGTVLGWFTRGWLNRGPMGWAVMCPSLSLAAALVRPGTRVYHLDRYGAAQVSDLALEDARRASHGRPAVLPGGG